jgi:hypothetical protein
MMICKVFGRERSWPNFILLSLHSPGVTAENPRTPLVSIAGLRAKILTTYLSNAQQDC